MLSLNELISEEKTNDKPYRLVVIAERSHGEKGKRRTKINQS